MASAPLPFSYRCHLNTCHRFCRFTAACLPQVFCRSAGLRFCLPLDLTFLYLPLHLPATCCVVLSPACHLPPFCVTCHRSFRFRSTCCVYTCLMHCAVTVSAACTYRFLRLRCSTTCTVTTLPCTPAATAVTFHVLFVRSTLRFLPACHLPCSFLFVSIPPFCLPPGWVGTPTGLPAGWMHSATVQPIVCSPFSF